MARPTRPSRAKAPRKPAADASPREAAVAAFIALLAEKDFAAVGLADIAERAGLSLATLRETFDGKVAILAAFSRTIDASVLKDGRAGARDDSPRDRLFDVMMRRFDALAPYKPALRRVARSARRDPGLACILHRISRRSARWTLAAAGVERGGPLGRVAAEGLVFAYLEAMRAWFDDDGTDLARTMAALDRALARGERAMRSLDDAAAFLCRLGGRLDGLRRGDRSGAGA